MKCSVILILVGVLILGAIGFSQNSYAAEDVLTIENLRLTDRFGKSIPTTIPVSDDLVKIAVDLTNDNPTEQSFVLRIEVINSGGDLDSSVFLTETLRAGRSFTSVSEFIPSTVGSFTIKAQVFDNLKDLNSLAPVQTLSVIVEADSDKPEGDLIFPRIISRPCIEELDISGPIFTNIETGIRAEYTIPITTCSKLEQVVGASFTFFTSTITGIKITPNPILQIPYSSTLQTLVFTLPQDDTKDVNFEIDYHVYLKYNDQIFYNITEKQNISQKIPVVQIDIDEKSRTQGILTAQKFFDPDDIIKEYHWHIIDPDTNKELTEDDKLLPYTLTNPKEYHIILHGVDKDGAEVAFAKDLLEISSPPPVDYTATGMTISGITADLESVSLILTVDVTDSSGTLDITIDRSFFDSIFEGADDDFFILVDGEEQNFTETVTTSHRTLSIEVPGGTTDIDIIGTIFGDSAPPVDDEFTCVAGTELVYGLCRVIETNLPLNFNDTASIEDIESFETVEPLISGGSSESPVFDYVIPMFMSGLGLLYFHKTRNKNADSSSLFIFKKISQKLQLSEIKGMVAVWILLAAIPIPFFVLTNSISPYLLPHLYSMTPTIIIWLGIFLSSIYFAKRYRSNFFNLLELSNLGPRTFETAKKSFTNKKSFTSFLVIFELVVILSFIFGYNPGERLDENNFRRMTLLLPIVILAVPMISKICSTLVSSMIAYRKIFSESTIESLDSDIYQKIAKENSKMTRPIIMWLSIIIFAGFLSSLYLFAFAGLFLSSLIIIFFVTDFRNGRYIKRLKSNLLRELDESEKNYRSEVEEMLPKNYVPTHEEMEATLLSYKNNLLQTQEQVKKIPNSFFQKRLKAVILLYILSFPYLYIIAGVLK